MSATVAQSTPQETTILSLIDEAKREKDPSLREMRFLEAELLLEQEQLKLLRGVERISSTLERHSRVLIILTVALLIEAVAEASIFLLVR